MRSSTSSTSDGRSLIEVVESVYEGLGTLTPAAWLARTLAAIQPCIEDGVGGYAYGYDLSGTPGSWTISRPLVLGMPEDVGASIYESFVASAPAQRRGLRRLGPSGTLSEKTSMLLTDLPSAGADAARALGVRDAVHVNALDPNGRGVLLAWAIAAPTRLAPAQRRRLAMIAAHVAGARRLLLSGRSNAGPVAVFERSGVAVHVDPAHEASVPTLQERLLRMEALREGRSTTDPTEVLASWQALHAGRYSLVGRFDADGRRYMVAYENAPQVRDPRGLSPLEASVASLASHGHAQKYIGYELGLAPGTVGGILTRVYRKLRVESRSELVDRMTLPVSVTRGRASFGVEAAEHAAEVLVFALRQELDAPGLTQERPDLTQAERDVALAAARGASNDAIAGARNTSRRTVEEQLGRAMRKLGVGSRAELTARLRAIDAPGTPGTPGTPATPVRRRTQAKPG